ncbi:putative P-loop containing nucleoside triphosphate hydrolase protein [Lyophyllum shimeji]|uniref:P-loop containing nucleoside triphosphate hydrolase protein n=1 Tax=Lyophyllum shimeji TaxID=47721 RepID=A0A9P3PJ79_LYOSH|nr:putative P-loop containing nucleoside triphosphate hydrolase protein [Lyophyllum shimeji]
MEKEALALAHFLVDKLAKTPPSARLLVGIAGIPASGKSTFALLLTAYTNELLASAAHASASNAKARLVGLDGWHLSRAQLDEFPDPQLAHDRRGIHWTFDSQGYVAFVRSLREPLSLETPVITAPSFDHALKDPTYDDVAIHPNDRIVIIEGLYTFLAIPPWNEAGLLLDERWYFEVDIEEAQRRLVQRHVATGVTKDLEEAVWRAEENDMPNGRFVVANMLEPTRTIRSITDPSLTLP